MARSDSQAALLDVTNADCGSESHDQLFQAKSEINKTFSRRRRDVKGAVKFPHTLSPLSEEQNVSDSPEVSGKLASRRTRGDTSQHAADQPKDADDCDTDRAPPRDVDIPAPAACRRYPRKVAPSAGQHKARAQAKYFADMRAHFQEVDAFELAVETPSPQAPPRRRQSPLTAELGGGSQGASLQERLGHEAAHGASSAEAPDLARAVERLDICSQASSPARRSRRSGMSFGLSRRRSSMVFTQPASRLGSMGAPAAAADDLVTSEAEQQPQPHSSFRGRFSIEAGLSRLSLGFSGALQRLGLRASMPMSGAAEDTTAQAQAAVSPIAESPDSAAADATPSLASPARSTATADISPSAAVASLRHPCGETPAKQICANQLRAPNEELFASPESTAADDFDDADDATSSIDTSFRLPADEADTAAVHKPVRAADWSASADTVDPSVVAAVLPASSDAVAANEAVGQLAAPEEPLLDALGRLLQLCEQPTDVSLLPSMQALLEEHVDLSKIRKVGEGTFGEAFKADGVVFKIVPLEGDLLVNGEQQKRAADIAAEVEIALTLSRLRPQPGEQASNTTSGFVETHGVAICRGRYAPALAAEWHAWDERNGSENDPVEAFPEDQLYVVFVVADGGSDLEHFELRSLAEANSVLLQVALMLAVAEEACQFEHRDLHWGNLLIKRAAPPQLPYRLRGVEAKAKTAGLRVTLIDFTLSRLTMPSGAVAFCDLSADPELFQGPKGDCQADTYRRMSKLVHGDWARHTPATNTTWIAYLVDALLTLKTSWKPTPQQKRDLRGLRKRAIACSSCAELVFDEYFESMWWSVSK